MRPLDPDRLVGAYGMLAAWTLLLVVVIRHVIGVPTAAGSLFLPTPLTVPILLILLPLFFVELVLLGAAVVYSMRAGPRSARGLVLLLATVAVFFLLTTTIVGFEGPLVLPGLWMESILWGWGLALLSFTAWWFRRASSSRPNR